MNIASLDKSIEKLKSMKDFFLETDFHVYMCGTTGTLHTTDDSRFIVSNLSSDYTPVLYRGNFDESHLLKKALGRTFKLTPVHEVIDHQISNLKQLYKEFC